MPSTLCAKGRSPADPRTHRAPRTTQRRYISDIFLRLGDHERAVSLLPINLSDMHVSAMIAIKRTRRGVQASIACRSGLTPHKHRACAVMQCTLLGWLGMACAREGNWNATINQQGGNTVDTVGPRSATRTSGFDGSLGLEISRKSRVEFAARVPKLMRS